MSKSKKVIGIDLGSYNSAVSVVEGNDVKVIPNSEGGLTTASFVSIINGEIKVGDAAKRQGALKPQNVIFNIKRLMGKKYEDVKNLNRPYKIVNNKGMAAVEVDGRVYTPEEISAMILQKMKKTAEDYLGYEVDRAVITIPAFFNNDERSATKTAGEIAGFTVERIVSEPTAALLNVDGIKDQKCLVLDYGGQTFDSSIVSIGDNVYEVLASHGDVDLGGSLIDYEIVKWLADSFKIDTSIDLLKDPMALQRLYDAAEKAKMELSNATQTDINLPYITAIDNVPSHLTKTLTRATFDRLIEQFVDKVISLSKESLKMAKLTNSDLNEIYLVGGSTRIPLLQEKVEKAFGRKPSNVLDKDLCVSTGAAKQGGILSGDVTDILLLDVTPISIGLETNGGVFTKMIEANTTIPCKKSQIFSTATSGQTSVEIHVLQGERQMAANNKSLGRFHLEGIPHAERGVPQIEVCFDIDANGILNVSALDKGTNKQNNIRIEGSSSLSEEEVARMKREAEENAEADRLLKEEMEKLNSADSLIYQTEKQIKEYSDKIPTEKKEAIEKGLEELKAAHTTKDLSRIDTAIEALNAAWAAASEDMYKNTATEEQEQPDASYNEASDNETVTEDAVYEEVK